MAVTSTPPITMSAVVAEFGGPGDLLSYLRGGSYVPDVSENSGVPAAAPIDLLDLAGAVAMGSISLDVTNGTFSTVDGAGDGVIDEGYNDVGVTFGSRSPTTINGQSITRMYKETTYVGFGVVGEEYIFAVTGPVTQDFIERIVLATGTLEASSATFTGSNTWTWSITPNGNSNVDGTIYYIP